MLDSSKNNEKKEPYMDLDSVDVSEYNNVINNSYSSEEDDDDLSSDDYNEDETLLKSNYNKSSFCNNNQVQKIKNDFANRKSHLDFPNCSSINNNRNNKSDNVNNNNNNNDDGKDGNNVTNSDKGFVKSPSSVGGLNEEGCDRELKKCKEENGADTNGKSNSKQNFHSYIYVRVKTNDCNNNIFKCKIEKNITIKKLKKGLKKLLNNNEDEYRIIYRGRLLKDVEVLSKYNIKFNDILYAIRINKKKNGNDATLDSGITSSQLSTIGEEYNDFGRFSQNDNISKLISSMFDNSDFLKSIMDSNKQLQKLREKNSEIHHMLNDSQSLKQSFEMIKNPSLMKELMRNTDRAISNIEAIPGGFNTLRRMYHNIQEPMYAASELSNENKKNKVKHYDLKASSPPTSEAFPNPWASKDMNSKNKNNPNDLDKYLRMNNNFFNNSSDLFKTSKKNAGMGLGNNNNLFKTNILDLLQNYQMPSNQLGGSTTRSEGAAFQTRNKGGSNGQSGIDNSSDVGSASNIGDMHNMNMLNNGLFNNRIRNNDLLNSAQMNNRQMYHGLLNSGLFNNGLFNNGLFNNGLFNNGLFNNGLFNNGLLNNGLSNNEIKMGQTTNNVSSINGPPNNGLPMNSMLNNQLQNDKLHFGGNSTNNLINQYADIQKNNGNSEVTNSINQIMLNLKDEMRNNKNWNPNTNLPFIFSANNNTSYSKNNSAYHNNEQKGSTTNGNKTPQNSGLVERKIDSVPNSQDKIPSANQLNVSDVKANHNNNDDGDNNNFNESYLNNHSISGNYTKGEKLLKINTPDVLTSSVTERGENILSNSMLQNIQSPDNILNNNPITSSQLNISKNEDNKPSLKGTSERTNLTTTRSNNNHSENEYFCTIYADQLNSLKGMGFTDDNKCIKALVNTKGNIERAIDFLLADMNTDEN
ncbi:ubiquitin domain containing protein [Plasmodium gonderi]|uniref:Ubiquitin domain containing protein n=1 Tax=Plasmodium gonderi TaxID=77519 RepID=A0A1Y1JIR0_PLAGO|nr:ubiquitin domain containing protein [Plasmodium gonderi]GAW81087.1 ubiquitin domain containing protein [Plasmodium gonderi]